MPRGQFDPGGSLFYGTQYPLQQGGFLDMKIKFSSGFEVEIEKPEQICAECLRNDAHWIRQPLLVVWCPHLRASAMLDITNRQWVVTSPVTRADVVKAIGLVAAANRLQDLDVPPPKRDRH